jgi:hypothetical protein
MVLHGFGKAETQVQFLLGAPNSQLTLGWSSDIMGTRKKRMMPRSAVCKTVTLRDRKSGSWSVTIIIHQDPVTIFVKIALD